MLSGLVINMLAQQIRIIYPDIDLLHDVVVQNIDGIETISKWDDQRVEPTQAQLDSVLTQAQAVIEQSNQDAIAVEVSIAQVKLAMSSLQAIIDGIDTATLAQAKTAIKTMAIINKNIVRILARL